MIRTGAIGLKMLSTLPVRSLARRRLCRRIGVEVEAIWVYKVTREAHIAGLFGAAWRLGPWTTIYTHSA